jgi:NIMA (never in mitosis gene a)-related kinase
MAFIQGCEMCFFSRQYLEEEFVLRVMTQLTLALKECHRRSDGGHTVLHRDLKPANVFLDSKHNVKLGDFGLARILNHDTSFAKTFVGTPYYMSPVSILEFNFFFFPETGFLCVALTVLELTL